MSDIEPNEVDPRFRWPVGVDTMFEDLPRHLQAAWQLRDQALEDYLDGQRRRRRRTDDVIDGEEEDPDIPDLIPTDLTLESGVTNGEVWIRATWIAPADTRIVGFELELQIVETEEFQLTLVGPVEEHTWRPVQPLTEYKARIRAHNRLGQFSDWSEYVTIISAGDDVPPGQVTGLVAVAGYRTVMLKWDENTEHDMVNGAGQYQMQRATNITFSAGTDTRKVSATLGTFADLETGTPYWFRVRAIDTSGNAGPWSEVVTATPGTIPDADQDPQFEGDGEVPDQPAAPTMEGGPGYLYVQWVQLENSSPVVYEVHISTSSGFTPSASTMAGEGTNLDFFFATGTPAIPAFAFGTSYYAKIVPRDADGIGPASPASAAATLQKITSTQISDNAIETPHLSANSITAGKIAAGEIQAGHIAANSIDSDHIQSDGILARHIIAGAIVSDHIHATLELSAEHITFGQMDGDRIATNTLSAEKIKTSSLTAVTIFISGTGRLQIGNSTNGVYIDANGIRMFKSGATVVTLSALGGNAEFEGTVSASTIQGSTLRSTAAASGDRIEIIAGESRITIRSGGDGSVVNYLQGGDFGLWTNSGMEADQFIGNVFSGSDYHTGPFHFEAGTGGSGEEGRYGFRVGTSGSPSFTSVAHIGYNTAHAFIAKDSTGAFPPFYLDSVDQSSADVKEDVSEVTDAVLDKVLGLHPIRYRYKRPPTRRPDARVGGPLQRAQAARIKEEVEDRELATLPLLVGFTAEEMAEVLPEVVVFEDSRPAGIRYRLLTVYLVKALQELVAEVRAMPGGGRP